MTVSNKLVSIVLAALLVGSTSAIAHDVSAQYGGRLEHVENFHVELVSKARAVEAFLIDAENKPMKATGYKGLAILIVSGKAERIPLTVSESKDGNKLSGVSSVELPARPRGVVQITTPGGKAVSARFD